VARKTQEVEMESYYEVEVHGEYFAQQGKDTVLRPYNATFKVPNAQTALGVIKGKLLTPFLMNKDKECSGVYTHHVDNISCHGKTLNPNDIPVRFQNKEQLTQYISLHQLPISPDDYGSIGLLRDHVRQSQEDPTSFTHTQSKYQNKKDEEKALFALNADILGNINEKPKTIGVDLASGQDKTIVGGVLLPEPAEPTAKKLRTKKPKPVLTDPEDLLT